MISIEAVKASSLKTSIAATCNNHFILLYIYIYIGIPTTELGNSLYFRWLWLFSELYYVGKFTFALLSSFLYYSNFENKKYSIVKFYLNTLKGYSTV